MEKCLLLHVYLWLVNMEFYSPLTSIKTMHSIVNVHLSFCQSMKIDTNNIKEITVITNTLDIFFFCHLMATTYSADWCWRKHYNIYLMTRYWRFLYLQLLKDLSSADDKLVELKSSLRGTYTTSLCLCIVGVFRKYHAYLLVSNDLTIQAFEG